MADELQWNIAKERVKKIAQILSNLRDSYEQARHNRDPETVQAYYTYLNSLFQSLWIYLPEDLPDDSDRWEREKFQNKLEKMEKHFQRDRTPGKKFPMKIFRRLEEIDRKLNQERKEMNLDIPTNTETDEGTEFFS